MCIRDRNGTLATYISLFVSRAGPLCGRWHADSNTFNSRVFVQVNLQNYWRDVIGPSQKSDGAWTATRQCLIVTIFVRPSQPSKYCRILFRENRTSVKSVVSFGETTIMDRRQSSLRYPPYAWLSPYSSSITRFDHVERTLEVKGWRHQNDRFHFAAKPWTLPTKRVRQRVRRPKTKVRQSTRKHFLNIPVSLAL